MSLIDEESVRKKRKEGTRKKKNIHKCKKEKIKKLAP